MRVLIYGAISYTNTAAIITKLNAVHTATPAEIIVDGTNRLTDQTGRIWAASKGVPWLAYQYVLNGAGFAGMYSRALKLILSANPGLVLTFGADFDVSAVANCAKSFGISVQAT